MPPHPAQGTTSVLIMGAGPGGLFAACELLRHGIRPRIAESRFVPHTETRATVLQPGVLELIDRGGLIEPFLRAGLLVKRIQLLGPGLREIVTSKFTDIGCKYEFQCSLPQWRTEAILREHLASLGLEIGAGSGECAPRPAALQAADQKCEQVGKHAGRPIHIGLRQRRAPRGPHPKVVESISVALFPRLDLAQAPGS